MFQFTLTKSHLTAFIGVLFCFEIQVFVYDCIYLTKTENRKKIDERQKCVGFCLEEEKFALFSLTGQKRSGHESSVERCAFVSSQYGASHP